MAEEPKSNQENVTVGSELIDGLGAALDDLRANKPRCVFVDGAKADALKNPDCLSLESAIFKNGGSIGSRSAEPFVELTPELLTLFRAIWSAQRSG